MQQLNSYSDLKKYTLKNKNGLEISFLERGILHSINYKNIMINQLKGNLIDGCVNNIYLRVFKNSKITFIPLIGNGSNSVFAFQNDSAVWYGIFEGIEYICTCILDDCEDVWFWNIELTNTCDEKVETDVIYIQDLSLADEGAVRTNEAYISQYIDYSVFNDEKNGYVVCSRQNQSQNVGSKTAFPWLMQGGLSKTVGFITDGFQFFGLSYKDTNVPEALKKDKLESEKLQYEFAMTGLQSERFIISKNVSCKTAFFCCFEPDHAKETSEKDLKSLNSIKEAHRRSDRKYIKNETLRKRMAKELSFHPFKVYIEKSKCIFSNPNLFDSENFNEREVSEYFGDNLRHREEINGELLSFFYDEGRHVVLKDKELLAERPHGHIMMSGTSVDLNETRLSTTSYMYGLFNSLVSLGNTSFSRILSGTRNPLNLFKSCGQRVFVIIDGKYELLGLPSAFEISKNFCRWFYKNKNLSFSITSWTGIEFPACYLDIEVISKNKEMEFLISNNISAGVNEGESQPGVTVNEKDGYAVIQPDKKQLCYEKFPETEYYLIPKNSTDVREIGGSELLFSDKNIHNEAYVVLKTKPVRKFSIKIAGYLKKTKKNRENLLLFEDFEKSVTENDLFWKQLTNSFNLSLPQEVGNNRSRLRQDCGGQSAVTFSNLNVDDKDDNCDFVKCNILKTIDSSKNQVLESNSKQPAKQIKINTFGYNEKQISKYNDLVGWYSHNAMVHYLVPHGLEQYTGAAWGVRDVCQGPIEFFLANQNYKPVRQMLLNLFAHQYKQRGDWPQWHMFDEYSKIQQKESHGDVIVWPLKALCDYIDASGDCAILKERISYTDLEDLRFTEEKVTLLEHVMLLIKTIKKNFIQGTALSCYGDGDWDDTLQPANAEQRVNMVSGWTVLLTYQTFNQTVKMLKSTGNAEVAGELELLLGIIREDYNKYIIKDDIAAGFIYFNGERNAEAIIHPSDKKTGINYRLLPMIRGMISEFFTPEQVRKHCNIIKKHLYCPDGVRLMDKPAAYLGGPNRFFKRAETAAYFGREVGLQYVHAHIRYVEAMAKIGNAEEVYKGLNKINPINISENVENAEIRQCNTYFSSSDGNFADRYKAQKDFDKLKNGEVKVKGGWRIYSSGPGIYINQVVSNFLGIRVKSDHIEIDPVIPFSLNGLVYNFVYGNKTVEIKYFIRNREFSPEKIIINGESVVFEHLDNPYRKGGIKICKNAFNKMMSNGFNNIKIYM